MSELILQAGSGSLDGSRDPLLGIVALRLKCWAPDLLTAINGTVPVIDVNLVENQPRTFSRSVAGDQGGYDVEVTLEGHTSPASADAGESYSLEGSTDEDPIEAHPEISVLLDRYEGAEDDQGRAKWAKIYGEDGARNPLHGVESYLVPSLIWSRKSVSPSFPAYLTQSLGTLDTPPGNPPALSGRRQWFKVRVRASWRGNVWEIEESWKLTGPFGVAPELYRRR